MAKNKKKDIEAEVNAVNAAETDVEAVKTNETAEDVQMSDVQVDANGTAAIVQTKPHKRRKRMKYQDRYAIAGLIFSLPFIIGFAAFKLAPLVVSLQLSFSQWLDPVIKNMQWVGWYNYYELFTDTEGRLIEACTSYITGTLIELPVVNVLAFFFAILLNRKMPGQSTFRAIFFLPVLIGSGYAYNIMSEYMSNGLAISIPGGFLYYLGGSEVVAYVMTFFDTFVSALWKTGVQVLLYLTGLQGISKTLYESAYCDGATEWEQFWKITLPMMTPTILLCLVYTLIIKNSDASNPFASYYMTTGASDAAHPIYTGHELATVSWVYALLSVAFILLVFLIMNPIIKKNGGRD